MDRKSNKTKQLHIESYFVGLDTHSVLFWLTIDKAYFRDKTNRRKGWI